MEPVMSHRVRTLPSLAICLCSCLFMCMAPGTSAAPAPQAAGEQGAPLPPAAGQAGAWGRTDAAAATPQAAPSPIVTNAQLIGATLRSGDGKALGPIVDFALDGRDGTVLFVAVAAERNIGVIDRITAVPIELIAIGPDGPALTGVSRARFAGAPKFTPEAWPDASDAIAYAVWAAGVWQYFGKTPTWNDDGPYDPHRSGERAPPASEVESDEAAAQRREKQPSAEELASEEAKIAASLSNRPEGMRATALASADVLDAQKQRCGRVRALCIDQRTGRVAYLAVALHKAAGASGGSVDDSVLRPLPWRVLDCQYAGDRVYAALSRAQLDEAPAFPGNAWPDLASPEWQQRLDGFFPPPPSAPTESSVEPPTEPSAESPAEPPAASPRKD